MRSLFSRPLSLVVVGWLLYGLGYVAGSTGFFGGMPALSTAGTLLLVAGLGAHAAALVQDLRLGRSARPAWGFGVGNTVLLVALAAWFWVGSEATAVPEGAVGARLDGANVVVTTASGEWSVPIDACGVPPVANPEVRSHEGVVGLIAGPTDAPFLTLHVAERRVECP